MKKVAIVLAAGQGTRMGTETPKQFLDLAGKPLVYYALQCFQNSEVDEIVLVTGEENRKYCELEIVRKYGITKVKQIVAGGAERYHSVYNGLLAADTADLVLIHDGARPLLTDELIHSLIQTALSCGACVAGVPSKDTIKIVDREGIVSMTPDRSKIWQVQTPQVFSYPIIRKAYERLLEESITDVTDDAMVLERMMGFPIRMVRADYCNIKVTTPEDLFIAENFLKKNKKTLDR